MARVNKPKLSKVPAPTPTPIGPIGPTAALQMAQPKAPGGQGFLINHNAFTDARPPGERGQRKSSGYPDPGR